MQNGHELDILAVLGRTEILFDMQFAVGHYFTGYYWMAATPGLLSCIEALAPTKDSSLLLV